MNTCKSCNKAIGCKCTVHVRQTNINSDQAGRDGLSAYQIAVRTGKTTATNEAQWIDEISSNNDGADGDTYVPINENSYFDV